MKGSYTIGILILYVEDCFACVILLQLMFQLNLVLHLLQFD